MKKKEGICYRISKSIIDWLPHADNGCETCDLYTMNKKGKRKKTKKNENVGRPKSAGFWNELPLSQCCYDFVGEENLSAMASINQNLCKCLCCICQKLMMRPLLILPCEHGSCRSCIMEYVKGKPVIDTNCPSCAENITNIVVSSLLEAVVDSLR